ncbi:MAG: T9SS type A sorting domain-containing protein, partial [Candidatus Kariarchaeaceae archaeon]
LLTVGNNDTTLSLQYYNGWENTVAQFWRPFESKQDTIAVYFRINMGGVIFDPASELVDVRGGLPLGGAPDWINIVTLSQEVNSVNVGSFQSGVAYVPIDSIILGTTQQEFKFVIQPGNWETVDNRSFVFSSNNDTTIHWYYFNDMPPSGPAVTADLLFRLKLDALEQAGLFDESLGDKVAVTGAKGWPPAGFDFDTEPTMLKMTYNTTLEEWNLVESFTRFPGEIIPYKYYIAWDTTRVDTASINYIPVLDLTNGWEEPGVTGGADRSFTYTDQTQQFLDGDFGYAQQFFNSIPPEGVITTPISVTFQINMAPATDVNSNPTNPLFRPGIDTTFIQFDGSFVPVTQGLPMYGEENRLTLDDQDGDGIYTGTWSLDPVTFYQLCYHVVYTSESGDIENGGGTLFGRRYYQYVHPTSINPVVWPATYPLQELQWMDDSLTVEDPPPLVVGVEDEEKILQDYSVTQNYPNPFNPTTTISYSLPVQSRIKIQVYDITGRLINTLLNTDQNAGKHHIIWNGRNSSNKQVSTGIYFLRFDAGVYTNTIKMMLLK